MGAFFNARQAPSNFKMVSGPYGNGVADLQKIRTISSERSLSGARVQAQKFLYKDIDSSATSSRSREGTTTYHSQYI